MALQSLKNACTKNVGKSTSLVPAVDRALDILALLRAEGGHELKFATIAKATGCPKASLHRIMTTLSDHGFVEHDEITKRYSLGIVLAEYGRDALNNVDIRQLAKPYLQELVEYSGETAVLAILKGTKVVMVDKREPLNQIRVSPFIGTKFPATTTSNGKALLAWLPKARVAEIMKTEGLPASTKNSIVSPEAYMADLAATRKRGYATEREEFQEGISSVSAPVFNQRGQVIATLSLSGPAVRMTKDNIRKYGGKCIELAAQLSTKMR